MRFWFSLLGFKRDDCDYVVVEDCRHSCHTWFVESITIRSSDKHKDGNFDPTTEAVATLLLRGSCGSREAPPTWIRDLWSRSRALARMGTSILATEVVVKRDECGYVATEVVVKRDECGYVATEVVVKRDECGYVATEVVVKRDECGYGWRLWALLLYVALSSMWSRLGAQTGTGTWTPTSDEVVVN